MNKAKLPHTIFRFFTWFRPNRLYEEMEGDLIQKFNRDAKSVGERKAKRRLLQNMLQFSRSDLPTIEPVVLPSSYL